MSPQRRVGFYATVHDRPAAGCTPDVNEANYEEYSTFFLAALRGIDRLGNRIERPDYDGDARISLEEAHAYVILNADTIDLPVNTSDEYLRVESKFGEGESDLLRNDESFETVLKFASPVQTVLLKKLSEKLNLSGENRIVDARRRPRDDRRRSGPSRRNSETRNRIANDLLNRWPELKNPFNPLVTEMLTTRSDEFVNAVKVHPDYKQFCDELAKRTSATSGAVSNVHYERFLRVTDSVVLAENLRRLKNHSKITEYEAIVAAEQETLLSPSKNNEPCTLAAVRDYLDDAQSQARSRTWVELQRGRVVWTPDYRAEGLWYVAQGSWPLPKLLVDTIGIDFFVAAKIVVLDCEEIHDLSGIKGLTKLEELYVNQHVHDYRTLEALRELPHLKRVTLSKWSGMSQDEIASIEQSLDGIEVVKKK